MNSVGERALAQILATYPAIAARVGNRVTWDDEEVDLKLPSITLRTSGSRFPAAELGGRGQVRQSLVEVSVHAETSGAASELCDQVTAALEPHEAGQSAVAVDGEIVRFGGMHLQDVQQTPSSGPRRYRKAATFSVWLYE